MGPWQLFLQETLSVPAYASAIMLASFFALGFLVLWSSRSQNPVMVCCKLFAAFTLLRYAESFKVFHHGLIEGAWPILWTSVGLFGAYVADRIGAMIRGRAKSAPRVSG